MKFIVAIDGPAGTGKSSVARALAQKLKFVYVDTGAIYRALALLVHQAHIEPDDMKQVLALIPKLRVEIDHANYRSFIKINDQVVDSELRSEQISKLSSVISQDHEVREKLLKLQRNLVQKINDGAIFEGRDIGTVVFPEAPIKIYITANSETRAKRRFLEVKNKQPQASYQDILDSIILRDLRDKSRANAPMLEAPDAVVIDTSHMTLEEVIEKTLGLIQKAQAHKGK